MSTSTASRVDISEDLIEAIRSLPTERFVEHCGKSAAISPFAIYYHCPVCGVDVKVRAFSGGAEVEDVFDAVFEWIGSPASARLAEQRRAEIEFEKE